MYMIAKQETILKAMKTVRLQAVEPAPRCQEKGIIYRTRSEWVDSCARVLGILENVLKDVKNGDIASLDARAVNMIETHKKVA